MKIAHYTETEVSRNDPEHGLTSWNAIGEADGAKNFYMRIHEFAKPDETPHPPHKHEHEHEVFVHSGKGEVFRNGEWVPIKKGDIIFIPGNEEHLLRNTSVEEPLVFLYCVPASSAH